MFKVPNGAFPSRKDRRDKKWVAYAVSPYDWSKEYDIEKVLSELIGEEITTPSKNQNGSFSCGGQAFAYYGEVLSTIFDRKFDEKSAKFFYSQCYVPSGGSSGRDLCKIATKQGWADERLLPSYENGNPPQEAFMRRSQDITQEVRDNASKDKALYYADVYTDIDSIASAIQSNYGCVIGITGTNNGTWQSAYPIIPQSKASVWRHWVYAGKVKKINGKKYIGIHNSWGNIGENGWQWLGEEFFRKYPTFDGEPICFEARTLTFKNTPLTNISAQITLYQKVVNLLKELLNNTIGKWYN